MISVIVPVFNVEKYLPECIDSILDQTFSDIEILLIDDGSSDNSGAICDDYALKDDRIRVFHTKNGGVSIARNLGIKESKGDLIAFVDGDDYIDSTMFEKLHAELGDNQIVFCRFANEYADKTVYRFEKNLEFAKKTPYDFLLYTDESNSYYDGNIYVCNRIFGSVCRQLFIRQIIIDNNIAFESGLKIAEDRLFLFEYLSFCKTAAVVDEYLYHYRANEFSATQTTFGKHIKDLPQRNELLLCRQIELVGKNKRIPDNNKKDFITKIKLQSVSEVVQNEIRYNDNYTQKLNRIFKESFYKNIIKPSDIFRSRKLYSSKKSVYYLLICLRCWKLIKKRIS